ncbi:hypothetical protein T01_1914 [Trichinella spiralis]|uniref:Uncharacterized protein n=1 Tax=Trichinella spiralis TaxID=6334 RepID=A0A0V1C0Z9_TRISP|nr:hypothetical protein T01_1914 [Trichinella spiralis]
MENRLIGCNCSSLVIFSGIKLTLSVVFHLVQHRPPESEGIKSTDTASSVRKHSINTFHYQACLLAYLSRSFNFAIKLQFKFCPKLHKAHGEIKYTFFGNRQRLLKLNEQKTGAIECHVSFPLTPMCTMGISVADRGTEQPLGGSFNVPSQYKKGYSGVGLVAGLLLDQRSAKSPLRC